MAIDMSKMKKKLDKLNNKGNGGGRYLKMEIGNTYEIRILPTPDGDPFKQYFVHYRVGDSQPFLSPKKNFNEDDALDRFVRKLYDEGSEESRNMARDLSAKARFFSPVIVRGQEDDGPKVWSYSKTVYQELLKTVLDPDFGDITDPSAGFDLKVTTISRMVRCILRPWFVLDQRLQSFPRMRIRPKSGSQTFRTLMECKPERLRQRFRKS